MKCIAGVTELESSLAGKKVEIKVEIKVEEKAFFCRANVKFTSGQRSLRALCLALLMGFSR